MVAKKKGLGGRRILLVVCVGFIFYISYIVFIQEIKSIELDKELAVKKLEIERLQESVERLEVELEQTKDLDYIEKLARERLKMVKPNELIYIIKDDE